MNKRQKIAVVILNILIIAELCISIYYASKDPENINLIFFKYLLGMLIPTLILAKIVIRRLRTEKPQPGIPALISEEKGKKDLLKDFSVGARREKTITFSLERPRILARGDTKLERAFKWRSLAGTVAGLFLLILTVLLLDSCIARFRQSINVLNVLSGTTETINGNLSKKVKDVGELTYVCSSDLIHLTITELYTGFWFGVPGWSGLLQVSPYIEPGQYTLSVMPKADISQDKNPPFVYYIKVHKDQVSYRESSKSVIKRYSGVSPGWFLAFFLPLALLSIGAAVHISRKIEYLMAKAGRAVVYLVREGVMVAGYEIAFGLGTEHGIKPGDCLTLFDKKGRCVGTAVVQKTSKTDSLAIAAFESGVRPGYIVSLDKR